MYVRRIAATFAVGLLATAGFATGASAAPPPRNPVVTASAGTPTGAAPPISYTVNRGVKQIASVTYSLNGAASVPAPAPSPVTKSSSGGAFTVTAADGENSLTVTVNLTDGGAALSNTVTFSYAPAFTPTCYDSPTSVDVSLTAEANTFRNLGVHDTYDGSCGGDALALGTVVSASDEAGAAVACRALGNGDVLFRMSERWPAAAADWWLCSDLYFP